MIVTYRSFGWCILRKFHSVFLEINKNHINDVAPDLMTSHDDVRISAVYQLFQCPPRLLRYFGWLVQLVYLSNDVIIAQQLGQLDKVLTYVLDVVQWDAQLQHQRRHSLHADVIVGGGNCDTWSMNDVISNANDVINSQYYLVSDVKLLIINVIIVPFFLQYVTHCICILSRPVTNRLHTPRLDKVRSRLHITYI